MDIVFRQHAIERMFERNVSIDDVKEIIEKGKLIAYYENDKPYPSKLLLKIINDRPLHVVIAENKNDNMIIVVTVYEPDGKSWSEDFERRI